MVDGDIRKTLSCSSMTTILKTNDLTLFQGDSITDCGRGRDAQKPNVRLGNGYAMMTAAMLWADRPADALSFLNRGVSGNRIVDLYARIGADIVNLKPDLISILIGVNDTWHGFSSNNGVAVPKYERLYRALLEEIREALPAVRLVLCEPFVLPCGVVTEAWQAEMTERRAVVRELATAFDAIFVPFQSMFDEAMTEAPPEYWAGDGVHPTQAGHVRMARTWVEHVTPAPGDAQGA